MKNTINFQGAKLLKLNQLETKLGLKCPERIKDWLVDNNVPIHKQGKKTRFVFESDIDIALLKMQAKGLIQLYPKTWQNEFYHRCSSPEIFNLIVQQLKINQSMNLSMKNDNNRELIKKILNQ